MSTRSPSATIPQPGEQSVRMERLYRRQAPLFDLTRLPILLGRRRITEAIGHGEHVLEVGCGTGHNLPRLVDAVGVKGEVVGVECAASMARRARRRCPELSILEHGFANDRQGSDATADRFDAIVFAYSLSMIPNFVAALDQARRELRPGGRLIVLDFVDSPIAAMRGLMRRSGVALGEARATAIRERFTPRPQQEFRAWGGLWRYRLTIAEAT